MRVTPGHKYGKSQMLLYFQAIIKKKKLSTLGAFDLISKLRARPEYQLYSGTKNINVILCDSHQHYFYIENTQSFLDNPSGPQSNAVK